uniref:Uncharacterized protein n=1 Tax=Phaseolus vulgaris TaxID=3885 RepID=V7CU63_PHAVU|nr:hypothetical protein PHAVU_002G323400g [Phaseolus vulgaris]ESW32446.1 hypothetical protein PHAVU_002G323400g [Phaseolus vulgaris]
MGGIGKTTICDQIYHKLELQFDSSSLVLDVQEKIHDPLLKATNQLTSQLQKLIRGSDSFGQGSRIIITSRDKQVLKNARADDIYEVKELNFDDSQKLFSLLAFKQKSSEEIAYRELSEKVLRYAKGIPLALQILGSLLYGRTREAWESQLQKLEKGQHLGIFNVLKLSYDGLEEEEKNIFLDIACFYIGHKRLWGLISVFHGRIVMHDLIQEMGKEIVRKECPQHPGKRSRLKNKGSDAIECISLSTSIECISLSTFKVKEVVVHAQSFEKMNNLRVLRLYTWGLELKVSFESPLVDMPDTLKILYWTHFPQRFWPPNFCPQNLVTLEMPFCHLEQLWEGDQNLPNLKRLDLVKSWELTRIPDLSLSPNIEEIKLSYCSKLIEIQDTLEDLAVLILDATAIQALPSSLCRLIGLEELSLRSCFNLQIIPSSIGSLTRLCKLHLTRCNSLQTFPSSIFNLKLSKLDLCGCSSLSTFPDITERAPTFARIDLSYTAVKVLPSSFANFVNLRSLELRKCTDLDTIFNLKLRKLDLGGCSRLRTFPEIMKPAHTFAHIDLTCTAVKELPSSFGNLVNLRSLELQECTYLESLPNSIVNMKLLSKLDCSGCAKLTEIPRHIGRLTSLMELSLRDSGIVNLPESIAHLSSLKSLDLSDCKKLECIPPIPPFLEQLEALDCPSIRRVMSNSLVPNLSNSKEGVFKYHFTNAQQLDSGARANIEEDARLRMIDDTYRCVLFCFPGSAVPGWFNFRGKGHSVTINEDLSFCSDDRLTGFALCVAFGVLDIKGGYGSFRYSLKFEYDDGTQIIPYKGVLNSYFKWDGEGTFVWKFNLESLMASGMSLRLCDARSFTFEISPYDPFLRPNRPDYESVERELKSGIRIKECGICPLYTKKKDDKYGGAVDYSASENDIEEFSGSNVAHSSGETGEDRKRNAESYPVN